MLQAAEAWAQSPTNYAPFLAQIRNRATVNGGSIDLVALVLSGNSPAGSFAFIDDTRILITPCFPMEASEAYNAEFYLGTNTKGRLVRSVNPACVDGSGARVPDCEDDDKPHIDATHVYRPGPVFGSAEFVDRAPEDAAAFFWAEYIDTQELAVSFILEQCTAYSYFA